MLRKPLLEVTLICLLILLIAQSLIGILSFSALKRLVTDASVARAEVSMQRIAGKIENGIKLGKPLAQYFGLIKTFNENASFSSDILWAAVALDNENLILLQGKADKTCLELMNFIASTKASILPNNMARRSSGILTVIQDQSIILALSIKGIKKEMVGALIVSLKKDTINARRLVFRNFNFLLIVTIFAGMILIIILKYFLPMRSLYTGNQNGIILPLVILMLAQGFYAAHTISTFHGSWINVLHNDVEILSKGLKEDLDRVLGYGVEISNLKNVETLFSQLINALPLIKLIELTNSNGEILKRADASGSISTIEKIIPSDQTKKITISLPLGVKNASNQFQGNLLFHLSKNEIISEVRTRAIDAMIVSIVALVTAGEMLLLLPLIMKKTFSNSAISFVKKKKPEDFEEVGHVARPVMFSYFFSWALPLGFLPLYARSLPNGGLNISPNFALALPISLEMACSFLTVLIAGRLSDHKGWQIPVLLGLSMTFLGMIATAVVNNLIWFSGARGLVGLGYGLIWMGLQGFIVKHSKPNFRSRNITTVIAGLYAGHLSGAAVGGLIIEQIGYRSVFFLGAIMLIFPLFGIFLFMKSYMDNIPKTLVNRNSTNNASSWKQSLNLLSSKDFSLVLLTSVIPFSIAQVGFLSFGLPLYLEEEGAMGLNSGRILMLYGLCIIYLGPFVGILADRTSNKKIWIILGGGIGSMGMLGLYFFNGITSAAIAVFFLAIASSCISSSILPYLLTCPNSEKHGAASITGLMRAADKLGQMTGPLLLGAVLNITTTDIGLALTGAFYLTTTLVFMCFSSKHNHNK